MSQQYQSNWGGYSSGSDDASTSGYELEYGVHVGKDLQTDYEQGCVLYPVKLLDHGSTYASVLYDVDGQPLRSPCGEYLNVMTKSMKEAFANKSIRLIHCMKEPTYRYFTTSKAQQTRFYAHRDNGAPSKTSYHVYVDDDIDRNGYTYRQHFSKFTLKT